MIAAPRVGQRRRKPTVALVERARTINGVLARLHPDAHCELNFSDPLELAVATILSAQCTDQRVNATTPALFARYPDAAAYAAANPADLESLIRPTGFFRNKTNSLIGLGAALVELYDGELPQTLAELVTLPGIGRKTANVILGNAFDTPGITVDTHVSRLTRRWKLTSLTDPVKIEHQLVALLPATEWTPFSHRTIFHGRRVCHARTPACGACALASCCPSFGIGPTDPERAVALLKGDRAPQLAAAALGNATDVSDTQQRKESDS